MITVFALASKPTINPSPINVADVPFVHYVYTAFAPFSFIWSLFVGISISKPVNPVVGSIVISLVPAPESKSQSLIILNLSPSLLSIPILNPYAPTTYIE